MKFAARTDIGRYRKENQDNVAAQQMADGMAWGIVCDGMGGTNGGKLAAHVALETMAKYLQDNSCQMLNGKKQNQVLAAGVQRSNLAVMREAQKDPSLTGMGTTMVCVCVLGHTAHIIHVGDSRAYLFREGLLRQLTRDHSMVQEMVDSGRITKEEAQRHPQKNLITRALGVDNGLNPDYTKCELLENDIILLCTDGLCNPVDDREMRSVLMQTHFFDAADTLVYRALNNGGQDNITVLLMGLEPTEE